MKEIFFKKSTHFKKHLVNIGMPETIKHSDQREIVSKATIHDTRVRWLTTKEDDGRQRKKDKDYEKTRKYIKNDQWDFTSW